VPPYITLRRQHVSSVRRRSSPAKASLAPTPAWRSVASPRRLLLTGGLDAGDDGLTVPLGRGAVMSKELPPRRKIRRRLLSALHRDSAHRLYSSGSAPGARAGRLSVSRLAHHQVGRRSSWVRVDLERTPVAALARRLLSLERGFRGGHGPGWTFHLHTAAAGGMSRA